MYFGTEGSTINQCFTTGSSKSVPNETVLNVAQCDHPGMMKTQKSANAILEALKVEMAQPHITASALAALHRCDAEQQKLVLVDGFMHRWR
jgi:hypothetical protein